MKNKLITAWRILVAAGMVMILFLGGLIVHKLIKENYRYHRHATYTVTTHYSDSYVHEYKKRSVRTKDIKSGKYLTPKLDRIFDRNVHDSLTVFFQGGKRGFLNVYTGQIAIPAQYEHAWVFSEGLGAVVKDGKLGFVDHLGEVVIPCQFRYLDDNENEVDFLFKGGYCTVIDENDRHGLIGRSGKWVIEPQYDYINKPVRGYRIVKKGGFYGLLDSTLNFSLPIEYEWIILNTDGVLVTRDGVQQLISYDGTRVLQPFVFDSSDAVWYRTDEQDSDGDYIFKMSDCRKFYVPGGYGLFNIKTGKVITKAVYRDIKAINNDLFECEFQWPNDGKVFINSKGEIIN